MPANSVISTTYLFHYLLNPTSEDISSFYSKGLRPLSDFPDSERWQQLESSMPGFYKNLYQMVAEPIIKRPYTNSGIFITPINFRNLPESSLAGRARFRIPINRLNRESTVVTYVLDEARVSLPFSSHTLKKTAEIWPKDKVIKWFGFDQTRIFFYVPQIAAYQGHIEVTPQDFDQALD